MKKGFKSSMKKANAKKTVKVPGLKSKGSPQKLKKTATKRPDAGKAPSPEPIIPKKIVPHITQIPSPTILKAGSNTPPQAHPDGSLGPENPQQPENFSENPKSGSGQNPEKKGFFASLKNSIMDEMGSKKSSEKSERLAKGKIDMAYLKATIQDTLKQKTDDKTRSSTVKRVPTGIDGFDQTIEGGLVRNSIVLLGGGPGSGKSIFGMQFLINGIDKYNEAGVYISFEEEPKTIIEDMQRFNWNITQKVQDKKLAVLYFSPEQVDRVIYIGGGPVREVIEEIGAKRIVIDSITAFTLLYKTENDRRRALMSLFKTLKKWNCTTIIISEQTLAEEHNSVIEEYESEGVIFLYHSKKGDVRERSIEIFKMRGTDHSTKINPIKISSDGVTVYPDEQVY